MSEQKYRQRGYRESDRTSGGGGPSPERPPRLEGAPKGRGADPHREEVFRCKLCGEKNDPEVARAAVCKKCGSALHACVQCRHFDTLARFQCRKPVPAPIAAKSSANDCAFFEANVSLDLTGTKASGSPDKARSAFDKLFGKR